MWRQKEHTQKTSWEMCAWLLRQVGSDPEGETDWSLLVISDLSLSQNPMQALLKPVVEPQLQSFQTSRPGEVPKHVRV